MTDRLPLYEELRRRRHRIRELAVQQERADRWQETQAAFWHGVSHKLGPVAPTAGHDPVRERVFAQAQAVLDLIDAANRRRELAELRRLWSGRLDRP